MAPHKTASIGHCYPEFARESLRLLALRGNLLPCFSFGIQVQFTEDINEGNAYEIEGSSCIPQIGFMKI